MIRIKEFTEEHLPKYYKRLNEHLEMIMLWRGLQYKAEAGSTRSEKGYQIIARSAAGRIARALGYDRDKTEALCACVGCGFPLYGAEGMALIRQYVIDRGLSLEIDFLEGAAVEEYISSRLFVASELDALLREYYQGAPSKPASCPELEVVRVCQDAVKKVKLAERYGGAEYGQLLYDTSVELCTASQAVGRPTSWRKLDALAASLTVPQKEYMTPEQKEAYLRELDEFYQCFGEEGVLKFLTSST